MICTSGYFFTNNLTTCEPIKPAPPVINIFFIDICFYYVISAQSFLCKRTGSRYVNRVMGARSCSLLFRPVMLFPFPSRGKGLFEVLFSFPAQLLICIPCIGKYLFDIAFPAADDLVFQGGSGNLFKRFDHFQHRIPSPCAQVEDL